MVAGRSLSPNCRALPSAEEIGGFRARTGGNNAHQRTVDQWVVRKMGLVQA